MGGGGDGCGASAHLTNRTIALCFGALVQPWSNAQIIAKEARTAHAPPVSSPSTASQGPRIALADANPLPLPIPWQLRHLRYGVRVDPQHRLPWHVRLPEADSTVIQHTLPTLLQAGARLACLAPLCDCACDLGPRPTCRASRRPPHSRLVRQVFFANAPSFFWEMWAILRKFLPPYIGPRVRVQVLQHPSRHQHYRLRVRSALLTSRPLRLAVCGRGPGCRPARHPPIRDHSALAGRDQ